ncbi:hypothetical protein MERGE_001736 [Pneumocystis wakefieldiae]|uniref:PUL domain-containing protein n=1 Tax=Pneumocystis wakefieldiae TaxID=38082 RepID=A0A899FVV7_9ASCO|nr:hypothetical protein MERGE_001736 [Pneumocystis wakefieldiae]
MEFNSVFEKSEYKNISLNPEEVLTLETVAEYLKDPKEKILAKNMVLDSLDLIVKLTNIWPYDKRFPGLDMLRIFCEKFEETTSYKYGTKSIIDIIIEGGLSNDSLVFSEKIIGNNIMLSLKALVNLFEKDSGRKILYQNLEKIKTKIFNIYNSLFDRNIKIALSTLYLNFSILFYQQSSTQNAVHFIEPIFQILSNDDDSECIYRALVALGTILYTLEKSKNMYTERIQMITQKCKNNFKELRIVSLIKEISEILHS